MYNHMFRSVIIFWALTICAANGICQPVNEANSTLLDNSLSRNLDWLKVEVRKQIGHRSRRVFVVFSNFSQSALWVPVERDPAYKLDKKSQTLRIWFGYFNETYGSQKGYYMLPIMHFLPAGEKFELELVSPVVVHELLRADIRARVKVRVAVKAFAASRLRDRQPLEDYINNSLIVETVSPIRKSEN